jgi:drug/metabolite transporter (DMT)-like permease
MNPIRTGVLLAVAAALAFGVTSPLVQALGHGVGPFTTAALLYGGAAAFSLGAGARLPDRRHARRLAGVAFAGAFVAPVLLAAGLQRTSGTSASLLLNLEAVFTVALGWAVWREPVGRRVIAAVAGIAAGGALLVLGRAGGGLSGGLGLLLVAGATLGWALDNTLTRPLSELDPGSVVLGKGLAGATLSVLAAIALHEPVPSPMAAAGILACGAIGYGASLRLYLLAQRALGSARTGSVFAVAPFAGAGVALALGEPAGGWATAAGAALIGLGVYLHLTEEHDHEHEHEALTHEHPHRHDDGHHDDHAHEGLALGAVHSHVHTHEPCVHRHAHGEDVHHRHHG